MQADNQPHNLLFTPRHVYIFPKPHHRPHRSFELYPETVGGPELIGASLDSRPAPPLLPPLRLHAHFHPPLSPPPSSLPTHSLPPPAPIHIHTHTPPHTHHRPSSFYFCFLGSFTVYSEADYANLSPAAVVELVRINTAPLPSRLLQRGGSGSCVDDSAVHLAATTTRAFTDFTSGRGRSRSRTLDSLPQHSPSIGLMRQTICSEG